MPVLSAIELFYALCVVVLGYFVFRWLAGTRIVNEIADEPVPDHPEPEEEILREFEHTKDEVCKSIEVDEARAAKINNRARRKRDAISLNVPESFQ
jgi:hypothetical protein